MLTVTTTTPVDGASNVSPNGPIYASFNKNLDPGTVDEGTVLLTNIKTNEVALVELDLDRNTVRILPGMVLDEFSSYRVDLVGESADSPAGWIIAADGDPLSDTFSFAFQTGEAAAASVTTSIGTDEVIVTSTQDLDNDGINDSLQTVEDASGELVTAYEDDLYLVDSLPVDGESELFCTDLNSSGITLKFSRDVDEDTVANAISIKQYAVAGYEIAGYSESDIEERATSTSNDLFCIANRQAYQNPEFSTAVSNEYIFVTFDDQAIRLNSEIDVTVATTLESTPDPVSGNKVFLKEETKVDFSTCFFPMYADVETIRLELASLSVIATDEVIRRYILLNSFIAWKWACRGFELCNPPYDAISFAHVKTVLDIFDMSQTKSVTQPGHSKRLGDFSIQFTGNARFRTPKELKLAEDLVALRNGLKRAYCSGGSGVMVAIKGRTAATTQQDFRMRTWKQASELPNRENYRDYRQRRLPTFNDLWS